MFYLLVAPSLLCGIVLCIEDLRSRSVPRVWVLAGFAVQLLVFIVTAATTMNIRLAIEPPILGILAACLQMLLAYFSHGSLGFGDVTASAMIGQAVGVFGIDAILLWWLAMGVFGLVWIRLWTWLARNNEETKPNADIDVTFHSAEARRNQKKVPFVPVIVGSAVAAIASNSVFTL